MIYATETENTIASIHIEKIKTALQTKWTTIENASYETGLPGLSLFYYYYALYSGDKSYFALAEDYFFKGIASLDLAAFKRIYKTDSLDGHLATIGRFIEFNKGHQLLQLDAEDYLLNLDESLAGLMKSKISIGNFDLNCGALAAGYYFLSRPRDNAAINGHLATLVAGIEEMAEKDDEGDYYWKLIALENRIFLGISHGSALIISFLANVYERQIENERCDRIIRKTARFLLKQKFRFVKGLFPNYIGEIENDVKQFSLCYGDIGIGYALYRAATLLDDLSLLAEADEILDDCLTRKAEDRLTLDASIVYGASGLAAAFEKLYRITGDERYRQASGYWYSCITGYAVHDNEFAGYKTRLVDASDLWNTSFGYGIIGIGISLMRYIKRELPPIDSLLFVA